MIVLLLAVCELILTPFVGGELWIIGQVALVVGLIIGWRLKNTTARWQSLKLGQAPAVRLPRNSLPECRAA